MAESDIYRLQRQANLHSASCNCMKAVTKSCQLNSNPPFSLYLNKSSVFTNYQPRQCNASYNMAFIVDWS